ncbi:unnamed protein product [Vitrella brassicaformis CCMP3155]|uniref:Uncharacterized protein n=1 Tax=Vitrella brassicaformis (strain CCMP3155) TaxID=1169540 RepID=A0A0G4FSL1_VITBC|nr:unnamed protein product [Vitrella brassicaformis CCMP3155]|eukprot:CEM17424.1 unnamed protein product [Vitrella brassicaformis CCMP3155]
MRFLVALYCLLGATASRTSTHDRPRIPSLSSKAMRVTHLHSHARDMGNRRMRVELRRHNSRSPPLAPSYTQGNTSSEAAARVAATRLSTFPLTGHLPAVLTDTTAYWAAMRHHFHQGHATSLRRIRHGGPGAIPLPLGGMQPHIYLKQLLIRVIACLGGRSVCSSEDVFRGMIVSGVHDHATYDSFFGYLMEVLCPTDPIEHWKSSHCNDAKYREIHELIDKSWAEIGSHEFGFETWHTVTANIFHRARFAPCGREYAMQDRVFEAMARSQQHPANSSGSLLSQDAEARVVDERSFRAFFERSLRLDEIDDRTPDVALLHHKQEMHALICEAWDECAREVQLLQAHEYAIQMLRNESRQLGRSGGQQQQQPIDRLYWEPHELMYEPPEAPGTGPLIGKPEHIDIYQWRQITAGYFSAGF